MHLPLHIFEPRYRALVEDALSRDQRIGMIQPRETGDRPALYDVGCIGRIVDARVLDDGRYDIVLEGLSRFRLTGERAVATLFRQVDASLAGWNDAEPAEPLPFPVRGELEEEARRYAEAAGYAVDWAAVARLDDETLVNAIAQIAPFDPAAKQALLEAPTVRERAELLISIMLFAVAGAGPTLQ